MKTPVQAFFDPATWTISYVVYDQAGGHAAIIDPVLDYDPKSGRTSTASAQQLVDFIQAHALTVDWILETHAHADHLSASAWLKQQVGGNSAIGNKIATVQATFSKVFNLEAGFHSDGSQFDHLFAADESFAVGTLAAHALAVPGHTPADMAYHIGDAVFVGDTLFMPDVGSARCDFPGGDAAALYRSARTLLSLPGGTRLFMCHDYPPAERQPVWESTVAEQRRLNIHLNDTVTEAAFIAMRQQRDASLAMPTLILPSVQINIRAGEMPPKDTNGVAYLKIPLDLL